MTGNQAGNLLRAMRLDGVQAKLAGYVAHHPVEETGTWHREGKWREMLAQAGAPKTVSRRVLRRLSYKHVITRIISRPVQKAHFKQTQPIPAVVRFFPRLDPSIVTRRSCQVVVAFGLRLAPFPLLTFRRHAAVSYEGSSLLSWNRWSHRERKRATQTWDGPGTG